MKYKIVLFIKYDVGHPVYCRYLVENYERNSRISSLIDNIDLHILPSLNPDGFENSNSSIPDVCDGKII